MRDRLVATLVGLTVAVVALYGIPRAYFVADLVHDNEVRKVTRSANLLAAVVAERQAAEGPVTESFLEPLLVEAETVEYVAPDGSVVRAGSLRASGSSDDLVESRPLPGGGQVTLRRSSALVDERVSAAVLPLVLLGVGLTVGAALVGFFFARRLTRPFGQLAVVADEIGRGNFDVDVPHYRVPEAEAIGEALRRGSAQLDELVRRERDFAVNASHELRSPITALRLGLEDLAMWPQTPPEVADELNSYLPELDRLSAAITQYLDAGRGRTRTFTNVDVDAQGAGSAE